MNYQGPVRRIDLRLRARYPDINTTIYKITEQQFLIKCENISTNFEELKNEFYGTIRFMGTLVDISENTPPDFIEIIPSISDKEISKNFEGIALTKIDLLNLLLSKFPNVHFHRIEDEAGKVTIYTASFEEDEGGIKYYRFLNQSDKDRIHRFLDGLKEPIQFTIVDEKVDGPINLTSQFHNPVQFIYAVNSSRNFAPGFSLRDEALWFDNIDNIFEGKFKKEDLYFYDSSEYSCYVDYSSFENIDLRNHLFLFQTVYITLPYERNIEAWLKESKIQKNEFLDLIKRNRIKVILTQPESRYDTHFIMEVYEVNPNAVITRRAIATLQQIDIVEMSDNYLLNQLDIIKDMGHFSQLLGEVTKTDPKFIYDFFLWPIRARRDSFELLNIAGLFSTSNFGINNVVEKRISEVVKRDLSFEFTVNASSIHLANSLNATYFPFKAKDGYSDVFYANVMGEMLNFYKNVNSKNIQSFVENEQKRNTGILPISIIDIIEINDYIPITELEEVLSRNGIYPDSKRLIESLADLSDEERKEKINQYNLEVSKKVNRKVKNSGIIDLGQNIFMDMAGAYTGFAAIGSMFSLLKIGGKRLTKSIPLIKTVMTKLEEVLHNDVDKANIHYLTKINRVARIRRHK